MISRGQQGGSASSIPLTAIALTSLIGGVAAMNQMTSKGCFSSSNGLTFQGHNMYQSTGACQDACVGLNQPVMGLTNGGDCWCGNLTPPTDSAVSDSECNAPCLGYGQQTCGGNGAFGIWLTGTQATVGSAQGSSNSNNNNNNDNNAPASNNAPAPASSVKTDTLPAVVSTIVSTGDPVTTTVPPETVTASGKSTTLPPSVVTVGGGVTQVVTIQPTTATVPSGGQAENNGQVNSSPSPTPSSGTSTGTKVGIAVGIVIAVLLLLAGVGFAVFYFLKKKRADYSGSNAGAAGGLHRNNTMHSYSTSGGFAANGSQPGVYGRNGSVNDSRLDPGMVDTRRGSVGSMFDDSEDYSRRVLKVTN